MTSGIHFNLLALQRAIAEHEAMKQIRQDQRDGYGVDADRELDELIERQKTWEDGQS